MDESFLPLYWDPLSPGYSSLLANHNQVPVMPVAHQAQYLKPAAASGFPVAKVHVYGGTALGVSSHSQYHPSPAAVFVGSDKHGYQMPGWAGSVSSQNSGSEYQVPTTTTTAPELPSGSGFINPALLALSGSHFPIVRTSPPPPPPQAGYQPVIYDLTFDDDNQDNEAPAESGTIVLPFDQQFFNKATPAPSTAESGTVVPLFDQQLPSEVTPAPSTAESGTIIPPFDQQSSNEATPAPSTTTVTSKPAEPKAKAFGKRTYAWLTPSAPIADMPNAKKRKLTKSDLRVRGLAADQARNSTALHFLNGPQAATPADVVTPVSWAETVAALTALGGAAEGLGLVKPAPKTSRGKKDGPKAAAATKKKAAGEGAKKKGKAPATKKEQLKEKMRSKKQAWKKGKVVKEAVVEREEAAEEEDRDDLVDIIEGAFDDEVDVNNTTRVVDKAADARARMEEEDDSGGLVDVIEGAFDDDDGLVDIIQGAFDDAVEGNTVVGEKGVVDGEDDGNSLVNVIDGLFDDVVDDDDEVDSGELIVDENPLTPGEKRMRGL
jgi:hypothetical protein